MQIIKYANLLSDLGHEVFITYTHSFCFDLIEVKGTRIYSPLLRADEVPDADAVLSSSWSMARKVADLPPSKGVKFAYLQDFENWSGSSEEIIGNWRQPVHLISVARYLEDAAATHTSKKATRIPYGIDFDVFYPENKTAPNANGIVIGGLYNSMPRKRFTDLLAVVEAVKAKGITVQLELFGAAERPDSLPADANYTAYPSRDALRAMMNRCHVWLAMSEQEGLHIPPMEAMACGAVPICTNIGGMRDYCLDRETGYRVHVGDIEAAASRIAELHGDPVRWKAMSETALNHIRSMGSEKENATRMADLFAACAGEAGMARLFDFTSVNHNTHRTLSEYLTCAERQLDQGETEYAQALVEPIYAFYKAENKVAGHPNYFSRFQDNYGGALALLNRIRNENREKELKRAFRYGSTRPGVMEAFAKVRGYELASSYANPARFDGKLRIYLTLKCNLHCSYCVNEKVDGADKSRESVPPSAWAKAINRAGRHVVFTGGEPFLYKNLPDLINAIDPFLAVSIYSNMSFDVTKILSQIKREASFFVSWHAHQKPDRAIFLANAKAIQANPLFTLTAHAIEAHENQQMLEVDLGFFRKNGVPVEIDVDQRDFKGCLQAQAQDALCRKRIYLLAPDGTRYQCVSRLMRAAKPMENILSQPLSEDICVAMCSDYGKCAPCDGLGETTMGVLKSTGRMQDNS